MTATEPQAAAATGAADAPRWWDEAVGYQVYIRSFADSDGDGVGDLRGIRDRLDHLAWLGVKIVWITPFYPSPMLDHGYDVADYRDIDPRFGTLDDFDALVARAHDLDLKVVIDLVPNHTSDRHEWFAKARSSRDNPHRDYYLWRDPAGDGGPPNNWKGHFGGDAWTYDENTGQYWCHLFLPEQPDLNWRNPAVAGEFDGILEFWFARGADGFRIDVAHALLKHSDLPDLPPAEAKLAEGVEGPVELPEFESLDHVYDVDQPEVTAVYRRWRGLADGHDALLLGEVYILDADRFSRYVVDDDGLHLGFWFPPLHVGWDAGELRKALTKGAAIRGVSWVQGSHDRTRAATRFGGGELGKARQLALATLMMGLPGTPFVYQGEELGLLNGEVPRERWADPIAVRAGEIGHSRDGCRTPMLWEPGPGWGFTTADDAWLPYGDRSDADTVAVQRDDPHSMLRRYRALIALRNAEPDLRGGPVTWLTHSGPILAYRRGEAIVAANAGDGLESLALPAGPWVVVFATDGKRAGEREVERIRLGGQEAVVLKAVGVSST
ncbi:MAG: alpha-amylase family glycosyl hydrolase [Egibacteraceae bacterium]